MMEKAPLANGEPHTGPNRNLEGYCIDLIQALSRSENFEYVVEVSEDYGDKNETDGTWNGIIGQLIRKVRQTIFLLQEKNINKSGDVFKMNFAAMHLQHFLILALVVHFCCLLIPLRDLFSPYLIAPVLCGSAICLCRAQRKDLPDFKDKK